MESKPKNKNAATVADLKLSPYNPRKITDKKLEMLKKSMQEFGDLSGIVFNVRTKRVVGGHQRIKHLDPAWKIIKKPHIDKVGTVAIGTINAFGSDWAYREVDWPEKKEMLANIAANKHGGEFDLPILKTNMIKLNDGKTDMDLTGFTMPEINLMSVNVNSDQPGTEQENKSKNEIVHCPNCGHDFTLLREK